MRRQRKVVKQFAKNPTDATRSKLNRELVAIEISLQQSYMQASIEQERKALAAIKKNPKYFFSYVKKFNKIKPAIGPLINTSGQYATDNNEMAQILSDQYSSVFSTPKDPPIDPFQLFDSGDSTNLNDFQFDESDIIDAIDENSFLGAGQCVF